MFKIKMTPPEDLAAQLQREIEAKTAAIQKRAFDAVWAEAMRRARAGGLNPDDYQRVERGTRQRRTLDILRHDGVELSEAEAAILTVTQDEYDRIGERAIKE